MSHRNRHVDTVLKNFALALLPALASPHQANRLFADHTLRAVAAHLTRTYGSSQPRFLVGCGGLASWQERRAKELLLLNLSGEISLSELASACRVSTGHFSQAFKQTVGCAPHQWLLQKRVERAKQLMLNTRVPLTEIALLTGFADQSHLTRVFSRHVKASPAAWRRAQGKIRCLSGLINGVTRATAGKTRDGIPSGTHRSPMRHIPDGQVTSLRRMHRTSIGRAMVSARNWCEYARNNDPTPHTSQCFEIVRKDQNLLGSCFAR